MTQAIPAPAGMTTQHPILPGLAQADAVYTPPNIPASFSWIPACAGMTTGAALRKAAASQKERQGIKSPVIPARNKPNDRMKGMPLKAAQMSPSPSPSFRRRPACMDAGGRAASGTGRRSGSNSPPLEGCPPGRGGRPRLTQAALPQRRPTPNAALIKYPQTKPKKSPKGVTDFNSHST